MTDLHKLLDRAGTTFADAAGITMKNTPKPLFQLLVVALLSSTRISADIAVAAGRELFHAGWRTPDALAGASHRDVVEALDRGGYARYDESTAPRLRELAERVHDEYRGDLRRLAADAGENVADASRFLQQFNGIGPVGAEIFLREVQDVWPWARPYLDRRANKGAEALGLPTDATRLAAKAPGDDFAPLAAALVRVTFDDDLLAEVR
ncbi:MAG: endonuclease [Tomitella sp.]|nr:endonuclease [Tomitella sp.]